VTDPAPAIPEPTDEDRRQHLGFIQAVVARMSAASATAKGWILPVVTATYGFALTQNDGPIALLGMAAVGLFAMLDANYLRQEQAYRRLYDTVARKTRPVPFFTLDSSEADDPPQVNEAPPKKVRIWAGRWLPGARIWLSWSIAPFYGGLLLVGLLVSLTA
jgi:hypothetical protein